MPSIGRRGFVPFMLVDQFSLSARRKAYDLVAARDQCVQGGDERRQVTVPCHQRGKRLVNQIGETLTRQIVARCIRQQPDGGSAQPVDQPPGRMILVVNEIRGQHSPLQYRNFQAPKNRLDGIGQIRRCEERGETFDSVSISTPTGLSGGRSRSPELRARGTNCFKTFLSRAAAPQGAKPALFDGVEAGQKIAERRCVRRRRERPRRLGRNIASRLLQHRAIQGDEGIFFRDSARSRRRPFAARLSHDRCWHGLDPVFLKQPVNFLINLRQLYTERFFQPAAEGDQGGDRGSPRFRYKTPTGLAEWGPGRSGCR